MKRALILAVIGCLALIPLFPIRGMAAEKAVPELAALGGEAEPLTSGEMAGLRGGYNGLAFRVVFEGFVDSNGNQDYTLNTTDSSTPQSDVTVTQGDGQVSLTASVGGFAGASGVFQVTQIPGSFNVVRNNLYVQLFLLNSDLTQIPSLTNIFGQ